MALGLASPCMRGGRFFILTNVKKKGYTSHNGIYLTVDMRTFEKSGALFCTLIESILNHSKIEFDRLYGWKDTWGS